MIEPLQSARLAALAGVRHAFFTRRGGVSTGLYESLNCGPGSDDDPAAVDENRRRAAAWFSAPPERLFTGWQVHSDTVLTARPSSWAGERPRGDAVVANAPGLVCGALAADCAPVLLADPQARVVAAAHAGWKGAIGGVIESAVAAMVRLGADPARTVAAVGPCIGPASYEVGPDFLDRFRRDEPDADRFFRPAPQPGKRLFDLPAFVLHRLARAGVSDAEWIGGDTYADPALFFSNRRRLHSGDPDYGRLLSAIVLDES